MAEPKKQDVPKKPPDLEVDKRRREAEKAARESEEEMVERATDKRWLLKQPPRSREPHHP